MAESMEFGVYSLYNETTSLLFLLITKNFINIPGQQPKSDSKTHICKGIKYDPVGS
jgi:hypothetical protein